MIKVAQILSKGANGGVESIVYNYYKNIDHSQFSFDFFIENESKIINKESVEKYGGRVFIIPSYNKIAAYKKCLLYYFQKENYDIVHSNISTMSFLPLKIAKEVGIKTRIVHSHSTGSFKEPIKTSLKLILRHSSMKYATNYFACGTKAAKFQFGACALKNNHVFILNNAIDINRFSFNIEKRELIRKKYSIPNNCILLGTIGRLEDQKNPFFLLKILKYLSLNSENFRLMFVGSGTLEKKMKAWCYCHKINNYVTFVNSTLYPEDYYCAFDFFLLPSRYEGLPVVSIEAQANGVYTILSDKITKEVKLTDIVCYLPIGSPKLWAEKISQKKSVSHLAMQSNLDTYNILIQVKKLENKYKDLVHNN